jgi:hypothetical protein
MRFVFLLLLTAICLTSAACSYITDFVVVNNSAQPIDVQYRVKSFPGDFAPPDKLAIIGASQLDSHGGQQWKTLPSDMYHVDPEARTVSTRLLPGDALRVSAIWNYGGHDDAWDASEFPIDEIIISGGNGQLKLTGTQSRTTFTKVSLALYTLTYK